jgi:hypothetical protein
MTAAEETRRTVGGGGATRALMTTKKNQNQQMSGGRGGGQRWLARGGAQWWRRKSDCCMAAEEKQHHGGWSGGRRQVGRHEAEWSLFFRQILHQSYPLQSCLKRGYFFLFLGDVFATIQGRIRIGVILWSFLVILPLILPRILREPRLSISVSSKILKSIYRSNSQSLTRRQVARSVVITMYFQRK